MKGLFHNVIREDIETIPWPHIAKCDVLPYDLYSQLDQTFPEQLIFETGKEVEPGKFRLSLAHIDKHEISSTWYEFMMHHVSDYFVTNYVKLFPAEILNRGISIFQKLKANDYGLRYSNDIRDINIDCQFILETSHNRTDQHSRQPHYDRPSKICDMLFYMKKPSDNSIGRDFVMYNTLPGVDYINGHVTDTAKIELSKTVPYGKNRYVLLPMKKKTAVHCASPFDDNWLTENVPTIDNYRRYFELIIEIRNDTLFTR